MQEVLCNKNKDCKRGCVLVPISNLSVCRFLKKERGMEVIRYSCGFPFETLFVKLQIASPNSCSSHSILSLPNFLIGQSIQPVSTSPPPTLLQCDLHSQAPRKASLPKISSDPKSPNPIAFPSPHHLTLV